MADFVSDLVRKNQKGIERRSRLQLKVVIAKKNTMGFDNTKSGAFSCKQEFLRHDSCDKENFRICIIKFKMRALISAWFQEKHLN